MKRNKMVKQKLGKVSKGSTMSEKKAVHYGQVELIPGLISDGYILSDESSVMSERGAANLLGIHHKALQNIIVRGIPKSLKPFWNKDLIVATNNLPKSPNPPTNKGLVVATNHSKSPKTSTNEGAIIRGNIVKVVATNSPHCGREIVVYPNC